MNFVFSLKFRGGVGT